VEEEGVGDEEEEERGEEEEEEWREREREFRPTGRKEGGVPAGHLWEWERER